MRRLLRCVKGHEWEPMPGDPGNGVNAFCPVCGEAEQTITTDRRNTPLVSGTDTAQEAPPQLEAYEILEEIGRGGMGIVYKARHREHNRLVALKIIRKDRLSHPDAVARFRREARAAARLSHPNIVLLFESDQEGDTHYLAMEYVPGVTLQQVVEDKGPLPVNTVCDYLRQTALALQHAHEQKLIHRDIKPSNLMAGGKVLKVLDMGVARLHQLQNAVEDPITTLTQHGAVIGTPDYIAPEQLENPHGADIRADLYSLGCTAYFLLTGQVPFPGGSLIQKLDRQRWEVPPSVEQLRADVPDAVAAVVRRLMAKAPKDRFQTPDELASALEELARTGQIASLARKAPLTPFARWTAHQKGVLCLSFLSDGKHLVSGGRDHAVCVWSIPFGREVRRQENARDVTALVVSQQGLVLVASGVTMRWIDAMSGEEKQRLTGHLDVVRTLCLSPDGRIAASGSDDKTVRLWDIQTGRVMLRLTRHSDAVTAVAFSLDGKSLASAGRDEALHLWDVPSGRRGLTFETPRGAVTGALFLPDGLHLLSAHFDTTLRIWDRETGREMRRLQGHRQMVTAVVCSANGVIASGGNDRALRLWDAESGTETAYGEGHAGAVSCLAFSPDGTLLASGSADGTICLWRIDKEGG